MKSPTAASDLSPLNWFVKNFSAFLEKSFPIQPL